MAATARRRETRSCQRCGRQVKPESLWRLAVTLPADGHVARDICVVCAAELRRFLLSAARPPEDAASEAFDRRHGTRAVGALVRGAIYVSIALTFFFLATWLAVR
jgi:hypothetical protein